MVACAESHATWISGQNISSSQCFFDLIDDIWTVFHGGSDFAIRTSPSSTPEAENSKVAVIQRKITTIDVSGVVWHGESDFQVKIERSLRLDGEKSDFRVKNENVDLFY